jgi:ParB family transcriptional regulator, chromosome partitioning protein
MNLQNIEFNHLHPSPLNPRKHFDLAQIADLADNIAAKGVLQNLIVRPNNSGFEIVAGERRFRAVKLLVESGRVGTNFVLPCRVKEFTDLELLEIATSENVKRSDMHPLEEADAFLQMVKLGSDVPTIALHVGMSEKTVRQRITLSERLSKNARKALLENEINLKEAQDLTAVDPKTQDQIIENDWSVDRFLKHETLLVKHAFFDVALYKGEISNNLFDDKHEPAFLDVEQAQLLQMEAVKAKKVQLEQKWGWVEILVDSFFRQWEYENLPKKGDKKTAGVVIEVSKYEGVKIHSGLIKPSKAKKDEDGKELPKPTCSKPHYIKSAQLRTKELQTKLAQPEHSRLCLELAVLGMLHAPTVRLRRVTNEMRKNNVDFMNPALVDIYAMLKKASRYSETEIEWSDFKTEAQVFEYLQAITDELLQNIFNTLVAQTVGSFQADYPGLGDTSPLLVQLAKDVGVDLSTVALDAEYFKGYSVEALQAMAKEQGLEYKNLTRKLLANSLADKHAEQPFVPKELAFSVRK